MDEKLISRLKEFYTLETFQVAYYQEQIESSTNEYYSKAFQKMVQIESGHAEFFAEQLDKANIELPDLAGSLFSIAGSFLGDMVGSTGPRYTCKVGVALENKAIKTYKSFIQESSHKNYSILSGTLMEYLLDEEFHTLWLQNYMENLPN
jgi:demethoxyubiquinone hydroxylase (CLK1/Coq7/Cat5 family)